MDIRGSRKSSYNYAGSNYLTLKNENSTLTNWIRYKCCLCLRKFSINSSWNEITFIKFTCMLTCIACGKVRLQKTIQNLFQYDLFYLVPLSRSIDFLFLLIKKCVCCLLIFFQIFFSKRRYYALLKA